MPLLCCDVGLVSELRHSRLCINGPSEPGRLRDVCVCQWVKEIRRQCVDWINLALVNGHWQAAAHTVLDLMFIDPCIVI